MIQQWGGDKAGSRQAQAIFAFLFVRGESGIAKDEVTELIWPDLEIKRADLAFHRTLGGLRTVLEQGRQGVDCITYQGGRYRLARDIVVWSDVGSAKNANPVVIPSANVTTAVSTQRAPRKLLDGIAPLLE